MKFVIDAGHGGRDSGATGNKLIEKKINLVMAKECTRVLKLNGQKVKMTRINDTFIDLIKRFTLFSAWKPDFCVSVHNNAGGGDGYEVIYQLKGGKSKLLATTIAKEFTSLKQNKRNVYSRESDSRKGKDYYAALSTPNCPAVITEFAFVDTIDYKAIDTIIKQIAVGRAIAIGCLKTIGIKKIKVQEDLK